MFETVCAGGTPEYKSPEVITVRGSDRKRSWLGEECQKRHQNRTPERTLEKTPEGVTVRGAKEKPTGRGTPEKTPE